MFAFPPIRWRVWGVPEHEASNAPREIIGSEMKKN